MRKHPLALALAAALSLAGCQTVPPKPKIPTVKVTVNSVAAPGVDLAGIRTYGYGPAGQEEPLVEQNLQHLFGDRLKAKGFTEDVEHPGLVIVTTHEVQPSQELIPEKRDHETYYKPATTRIVTHYDRRGTPWNEVRTVEGEWKTRDKVTPAKVESGFLKKVHVALYRLKPGAEEEAGQGLPLEATPVWEGNVYEESNTSDLLKAAPLMLRELAAEFPIKSGRPETRSVPLR